MYVSLFAVVQPQVKQNKISKSSDSASNPYDDTRPTLPGTRPFNLAITISFTSATLEMFQQKQRRSSYRSEGINGKKPLRAKHHSPQTF